MDASVAIFCHSILSDWNHGNAHFLRGIATELQSRGIEVRIFEPRDGWSLSNLHAHGGEAELERFHRAYPTLRTAFYDLDRLDLDRMLDGVDLVLVHEWTDPVLVRALGEHRRRTRDYRILFHDTHHRMLTAPDEMAKYDLSDYDGALVFGEALRQVYEERGVAHRAWTWHEAADVRVFRPEPVAERWGDVVWIGNWGDEERSEELREMLVEPVRELRLEARVYGVRYTLEAQLLLARAGIAYLGWLPNVRVPDAFARFSATVHIPRRPYVEALEGIPTIRVFEALACGIPLVCAYWCDVEGLFRPGADYLWVDRPSSMIEALRALREEPDLRDDLAAHGRRTILERHTCAHRVDELLRIAARLGVRPGWREAVA